MDCEGIGAVSGDGLVDGVSDLGQNERFWIMITGLDEGVDDFLKSVDAAMDTVLDLPVSEERKPAFDLVQPGGAGRGELRYPLIGPTLYLWPPPLKT